MGACLTSTTSSEKRTQDSQGSLGRAHPLHLYAMCYKARAPRHSLADQQDSKSSAALKSPARSTGQFRIRPVAFARQHLR
jgi:hypothetical protein